ncbi:LacI family DNA-binding transcriptional regulator [Paenibacillus donghaensis]|uniref:HTH lacI-type domain-containing protein n=1 Tax=Paenibacillus donghaensis TaxID=414771 RepID=A0A2Z2KQB5_9BACL|nr:LacI family DNA-binding transcriptional regulator [Paenibacillus donghaensis]ASA22501.1 hypothetical protein B9T62_17960 [Paenibacillus donghaensis]
MKKTTMKDIAQRAQVSVATVSYVLNRVGNQTIPVKTRQQILQIAEELQYIPNLAARSLAKQKTGLVGILLHASAVLPYWKQQAQFSFIRDLELRLTQAGYHTVLHTLDAGHPSLDIIVERKLEAVFLIDAREETFYSISRNFGEGTPLILIDSMIEDLLFKQVLYNYRTALQQLLPEEYSQVCLIMENFNNILLTRYIRDSLPLADEAVFQVSDQAELDSVLQRSQRFTQAIVINEWIGNSVEKAGVFEQLNVLCTCNCPEILRKQTRRFVFAGDKAAAAFELMKKLLHQPDYSTQENNRIFIN